MRTRYAVTIMLAVSIGAVESLAQQPNDAPRRSTRYFIPHPPVTLVPGDKEQIGKWIVDIVTDAAERGTEIYNQGAYIDSYLYFQATLLAVINYLSQDQDLSKRTQRALARANVVATDWEAAIVLRTALNDILNRVRKGNDGNELPLWDRLGGEDTVRAFVRMAFDAAAADPKVNFTRNGDYPYTSTRADRLEQLGVEAIRSLPDRKGKSPKRDEYSGRSMKNAHQGMKITRSEFSAARKQLLTALRYNCIPDLEIQELMSYVDAEMKNIIGQ
jgi:hypothetical protein